MGHIKSCGIMIAITVLALLWWFRDPFKPYDTMPFSIEPYVAYDSILATYGFKEDSLIKPFYRNYLITGFADTLSCERKIDSLLPSLIDTFYDYKKSCTIWFFKKSNKCNNAYTRWDREWTENFAETQCIFVKYEISIRKPEYDFVLVNKTRAWESKNGNRDYLLRWYANSDSSGLRRSPIGGVPASERNLPLEYLFEKTIENVKNLGNFKKDPHSKEIKEYIVR